MKIENISIEHENILNCSDFEENGVYTDFTLIQLYRL